MSEPDRESEKLRKLREQHDQLQAEYAQMEGEGWTEEGPDFEEFVNGTGQWAEGGAAPSPEEAMEDSYARSRQPKPDASGGEPPAPTE